MSGDTWPPPDPVGVLHEQLEERTPGHPTRRLRHPDGSFCDIDVEIADLIAALWVRGIDTIASCQDYEGKVTVAFRGAFDAVAFARAIGLGYRFPARGRPEPDPFRGWRWKALPLPDRGDLRVFLAFPRDDLAEVQARLGSARREARCGHRGVLHRLAVWQGASDPATPLHGRSLLAWPSGPWPGPGWCAARRWRCGGRWRPSW